MNRDTLLSFDTGGLIEVRQGSSRVQQKSKGKIIAVIENYSQNPSEQFQYHSDEAEPLAMIATGEGFRDEFVKSIETIDGKLYSADIRSDNVRGSEISNVDIQFDYSPGYEYIGLGLNINAFGSYKGHRYFDEWSDYGSDTDNYSIWCTGGGNALEDADCRITKSETSYSIVWTFKECEQRKGINGTEYITREGSLSATLTPVPQYSKSINEN